jgi:hypothetical protein
MPLPQPVVQLSVDDPRADKPTTTPGCGLVFQPTARTRAHSYPWDLLDVEYLDRFKGFAPMGRATRTDMTLAEWTSELGWWDDKSRPALSPRTTFLHCYASSVQSDRNLLGRITSKADWHPHLYVWLYRYVPHPDCTLATTDVSVKLLGDGVKPAWRVVIPGEGAQDTRPYLLRQAASGLPATRVSYYDGWEGAGAADSQWHLYGIWIELTLNTWQIVITVDGKPQEQPWYYTPAGTDISDTTPLCGAGQVQVQTQGQQIMFAAAPILYPKASMVRTRYYFEVPAGFGDVDGGTCDPTCKAVIIKPSGTSAEATVTTQGTTGNGLVPIITFVNDAHHRAVCGVIGVRVPPVLGTAVTSAWTSTGQNNLAGSIRYRRRSTWKGNECSFELRDPTAALTWKGNNVVQLKAAMQTEAGVTPTLASLFRGYAQDVTRTKDGRKPMGVSVTAADFAAVRMPRKTMAYTRAYGGFAFADALVEIGEHCGFAAANITNTVSALAYLPINQVPGQPAYSWGENDTPDKALDVICKAVGAVWGIAADGKLFAAPVATYSSGDEVYTLDSDTTDTDDYIAEWRHQRSLEDFANSVLTYTGEDGQRQIGWALSSGTITDPNDRAFVGDYWWTVEQQERSWATAQTLAAATLLRKARFAETLHWKPCTPHPEVIPGTYIKAQLETSQVTANGIFLVVEDAGELLLGIGNSTAWQQEFAMVRVA